jgi:4a-hydroxytetrahydrobiopterin dehydratase
MSENAPLDRPTLLAMSCGPMEGRPAMAADAIAAQLQALPGWALADGALQRRFDFADYHRTLAFVNALAWIAHREDHHPDLLVSYNRCTVRFNTHSVGGISINDFVCAAKVDALLP